VTMSQRKLLDIMLAAKAVLFDFDGPLCDVFARLPASNIARELRTMIDEDYYTDDPMEVLRLSGRRGTTTTKRIEDALITAEVAAVRSSLATPGGIDSIRACITANLPVGIVSNNSSSAISVFLNQWDLMHKVTPVVGRAYLHPELMKPNVEPMNNALRDLNCRPSDVVFVGDSLTDIEVAKVAGIPCVAYANKPGKRAEFNSATVVIDSMWELYAAIRNLSEQ
jgi:HAD superfamily hydrolase (TIGR01662 family)